MTRGEIWFERRAKTLEKIEQGKIKVDLSEVDFTANLPKPLPRKEALEYYNNKLKKYWVEAGYYKKAQKLVALEWIRYWIERAHEKGYQDAREASI